MVIFMATPVLLWSIHWMPMAVHFDEYSVISCLKESSNKNWFDIFGHNPVAPFKLYRLAADVLGGVTLYHVRLIHAILASISVGAAMRSFDSFVRLVFLSSRR